MASKVGRNQWCPGGSGKKFKHCHGAKTDQMSLAMKLAAEWIIKRQEADGCWGGIQPPWVYSLLALHLLGYPMSHPVMARGIAGLERFLIVEGDLRRLEACQSPVWDTALAMVALRDAGVAPEHPSMARGADWLLRIREHTVFEAVRREVAVGQPVWESQRLLDQIDSQDQTSFVDEFLKDRAGQSLAHVFTLLSLVLPKTPLQIAYRGLHTDAPGLRGTALEYLEEVLPPDIRDHLWPFLGDARPRKQQGRSREAILDELIRSNESIMMNLEELRRHARAGRRPDVVTGA